jgi:two-component system OmpR family response regulator/two-component system response regulator QseB
MRILLVEDDALLGDGLQRGLMQAGFQVDWVRDGVAAELALKSEPYAAAVLDLGLPRKHGIEVLKSSRSAGVKIPVLILTARDALHDRVRGLDNGADDYVVKPVDLRELAARLRALIRRSAGEATPVLRSADVQLDVAARTVHFRGSEVLMQPREFDLLHALMMSAGRVLTREMLEEKLYRWGDEVESNALEVHIHHLRRKLAPEVIRTVRGVGYLIPLSDE